MTQKRSMRAFTLIEMAIVLLIISIITGMAIQSGMSVVATARLAATKSKMAAIDQALMQFRTSNDRLPCPSDLTLAPGSANYGLEAGAGSGSAIGVGTGACTGTGMLPAANFTGTGATNPTTAAEGALPAVTLGLSPDFMVDGWGNKFRYAVDVNYTANAAFANTNIGCINGAVTVNDVNGNARSTGSVYALISHGANGHGAYTRKGVTVNAGSVNANELTNCHCNSRAAATTYAPTYVQASPSVATPGNPLTTFDDLVSYKDRWQMQTAWDKTGGCGYIYVADMNNNRVEVFTMSGTYVSQFGSAGTGNGQFNLSYSPEDITIDTTGNLWVTDDGNMRIQKFSSSGTWLASLGGTSSACTNCLCTSGTCPVNQGSGNGQFSWPSAARLDSSGNIWVDERGNNRVQEFSSSGTYLSQFPIGNFGAPNKLAVDSSNNIWISLVDGGYLGEWNSSEVYQGYGITLNNSSSAEANYIGFDAGGNIYATDGGNNVVQKFTKSGTYVTSFGSSGSGNGQLSNPNGIAIDSSGNIWVADFGNNRVEEFSSSGTFLMSIGGTASACSNCACTGPSACPTNSGSGNGQFNSPIGIAIGSR